MTASAEQITQVRRWLADTSASPLFTDQQIGSAIEVYPRSDSYGYSPTILQNGTLVENTLWSPTYDLHAAAADLWLEKAGGQVGSIDYNADGAQFAASQLYEHCMNQVRFHQSRRAIRQVRARPDPTRAPTEFLP